MRKIILISSLLVVIQANAATMNEATSSSNSDLQLGASVIVGDKGFRNYDSQTQIYPAVFYEKNKFYIHGNQLGVNLIKDNKQELALNALYSGESYDADDATGAYQGLDDRDNSIMLGASYQHRVPYGALRGQVATDVSGNSDGTIARVSFGTRIPVQDWTLLPNIGLQWQDDKYNDYYYGVTAQESARTGIAQYTAKSSIQPFASLTASYQLTPLINLFATPSVTYYADEINDSPKIDSRTSWATTLGITYKLK